MFSEIVLEVTIGLGDNSWAGGALDVHRGVARMNRGDKGHASADEIGWRRHDEGEVTVVATAAGRMDRPRIGIHLFLQRLEAGVVGSADDHAKAWMRK